MNINTTLAFSGYRRLDITADQAKKISSNAFFAPRDICKLFHEAYGEKQPAQIPIPAFNLFQLCPVSGDVRHVVLEKNKRKRTLIVFWDADHLKLEDGNHKTAFLDQVNAYYALQKLLSFCSQKLSPHRKQLEAALQKATVVLDNIFGGSPQGDQLAYQIEAAPRPANFAWETYLG